MTELTQKKSITNLLKQTKIEYNQLKMKTNLSIKTTRANSITENIQLNHNFDTKFNNLISILNFSNLRYITEDQLIIIMSNLSIISKPKNLTTITNTNDIILVETIISIFSNNNKIKLKTIKILLKYLYCSKCNNKVNNNKHLFFFNN